LPAHPFKTLPAGTIRLVPQASLVLLVVAIGMTMMGLTSSLREIVKEQPVFKRELAVGLSTSAYVLSKMTILGLFMIYQAVVYMTISTANQGGPGDAVVLGWPLGDLIVAAPLVGMPSLALGPLCSPLVNSVAAAIGLMPSVRTFALSLPEGGVLQPKA